MNDEIENAEEESSMGELGYRIISQSHIDDQLVMQIETKDLAQAIEDIKEDNSGKSVSEFPQESKPSQDLYVVKVS